MAVPRLLCDGDFIDLDSESEGENSDDEIMVVETPPSPVSNKFTSSEATTATNKATPIMPLKSTNKNVFILSQVVPSTSPQLLNGAVRTYVRHKGVCTMDQLPNLGNNEFVIMPSSVQNKKFAQEENFILQPGQSELGVLPKSTLQPSTVGKIAQPQFEVGKTVFIPEKEFYRRLVADNGGQNSKAVQQNVQDGVFKVPQSPSFMKKQVTEKNSFLRKERVQQESSLSKIVIKDVFTTRETFETSNITHKSYKTHTGGEMSKRIAIPNKRDKDKMSQIILKHPKGNIVGKIPNSINAAPQNLADIAETVSAVAAITPDEKDSISNNVTKEKLVYVIYPANSDLAPPQVVLSRPVESLESDYLLPLPYRPQPESDLVVSSTASPPPEPDYPLSPPRLTPEVQLPPPMPRPLPKQEFNPTPSKDVEIEPPGRVTPVDISKILNQGKRIAPLKSRCQYMFYETRTPQFLGFRGLEKTKTSCLKEMKALLSKEEKSIKALKKSLKNRLRFETNFVHCGNANDFYLPEIIKTEPEDFDFKDETAVLPTISEMFSQVREEVRQLRQPGEPKASVSKTDEALQLIKRGLEMMQSLSQGRILEKENSKKTYEVDQVMNKRKRGRPKSEDGVEKNPVKKTRGRAAVNNPGDAGKKRRGKKISDDKGNKSKRSVANDVKKTDEVKKRGRKKAVVDNDDGSDLLLVKRVDIVNPNSGVVKKRGRKPKKPQFFL